MTALPPATAEQWRAFLRDHSAAFLASDYLRRADADDVGKWMADGDQRAAGWLGCAPAAEEAIAAAEARLGVRLPPSYRNFLLVSDGWSCLNYTLDLVPVAEAGWLPDVETALVEAWTDADPHFLSAGGEGAFLRRCLVVSSDDGGSGGIWMLHAGEVDAGGEWRAYEWWPGDGDAPDASPSPSFAALVTAPA